MCKLNKSFFVFQFSLKRPKPLDMFMKEQNFTMTDRKKLLTEICKKYNISIGTYSNITVNRFMMCINPYQICFCPNAKTGTTTWMQRIMVIYIIIIICIRPNSPALNIQNVR